MTRVLLVALAGATGSVLRYRVERHGLVVVNLIGSFVLGIVVGVTDPGTTTRIVLATGFCGAFTTFSGFVVDARPVTAVVHVAACLAAAALGLALG